MRRQREEPRSERLIEKAQKSFGTLTENSDSNSVDVRDDLETAGEVRNFSIVARKEMK
jgi:hypothetical protein